ncbi:DUF6069 family protein [Streptomyces sp. cmx-18-6]|uniref:DUF6069 family protein n=1 Tax=Streptomyces sp. cmx-18-6 TaxID=2790930 RepID=UPI003981230A
MSNETRAARTSTPPTSSVRPRAIAVVAATVAALVVWGIGKAAGADLGVVLSKGEPKTEIGFVAIAVVGLFAALVGWGVLALLEKFVPAKALLIWTVLASAVTVLSLLPVLSAEASGGAKVTLALTHVAVAAVAIPLLRRSAAPSR